MPRFIAPQLSLSVTAPPEGPDWAHEIKLDGYRLHARLERGRVKLLTRTGLDWTPRYETMAAAVAALDARGLYLDGEICAVHEDGVTSFPELQAATEAHLTAGLVYFVFDLLFLDGRDWRVAPLRERKEALRRLLVGVAPPLVFADHHEGEGGRFFKAVCGAKAEGVISKRIDAAYVSGNRGLWRKAKCYNREEFVICGYSRPEGERAHLGALLLAYYDEAGHLRYAGRAGTGMSDRTLRRLHERLEPLRTAKMPLDLPPPGTTRYGTPVELSRVNWVRPELVCEVRFLTWTADGLLRDVSFEGLREDKPAREVRRSQPASPPS
ncbi:MAG TPA: non-homologous end-joining DNA ligase [Stellaceae bacterium]|nr:non-homologous end-joining DNA ligase [Stellaceae bacterium]